jgi:ACR3 family arsenite efflux pump ArsB
MFFQDQKSIGEHVDFASSLSFESNFVRMVKIGSKHHELAISISVFTFATIAMAAAPKSCALAGIGNSSRHYE